MPADLVSDLCYNYRSSLYTDVDVYQGKMKNLQLDITKHVRPGTNTVRFIQLADLSEFVFILHAAKASISKDPSTSEENISLERCLARLSRDLGSTSLRSPCKREE